jgi:hypothetical protein
MYGSEVDEDEQSRAEQSRIAALIANGASEKTIDAVAIVTRHARSAWPRFTFLVCRLQ